MRNSIKIITTALALAAMGAAQAAEQSQTAPNRALHLAIATQGDQALLDIQSEMREQIPQSMREQMAASLQGPLSVSAANSPRPAGSHSQFAATADY